MIIKKNMTFEAAMARLDVIVEALDNPDTPLDDSLKLFGEGAELLGYCNKKLGEAKLAVVTLFPDKTDPDEVEDAGH